MTQLQVKHLAREVKKCEEEYNSVLNKQQHIFQGKLLLNAATLSVQLSELPLSMQNCDPIDCKGNSDEER